MNKSKCCTKCFRCIGKYEWKMTGGLCADCYFNQFHSEEKEYRIKRDEIIRDYYRNEFDKEINK